MPELPDLQVFSRNLHKKFAGKKLVSVEVKKSTKLKGTVKALQNGVENQKLVKVYREGKELFFKFANDNIISLHLMLKGELHEFKEKNENKYSIIEFHFNDRSGFVLTDYQGAAHPTFNPEQKDAPDVFSKEFNLAYLKNVLARTGSEIKTVLLDQKKMRGIGNAYADEILWDAKISPFSISNKIPDKKVGDLLKSIKKVLNWAEKQIVKADPGIISGEMRDFLKIHTRKKTESPTGSTIKVHAGSRKTYYTAEQKIYK